MPREHGGFVTDQLREAIAADLSQCGLDRHVAFEGEWLGMNRDRGLATRREVIASFRFAARLDPNAGDFEHLQRDIAQRDGLTALYFELDFADRLDRVA